MMESMLKIVRIIRATKSQNDVQKENKPGKKTVCQNTISHPDRVKIPEGTRALTKAHTATVVE